MIGRRLLACGDAAVLVEVADLDAALALHDDLRAHPPAGLVDVVPAGNTVLVRVDPAATTVAALRADLAGRVPARRAPGGGGSLTVPVIYDGGDLAAVAGAVGWSVERLVAEHQRRTWRVAFVGFAPGFGYLVPDGPWPDVPRHAVPRTSVPAGSVALAGGYAGVYPASSPGGWQLLGRTDLVVWAVDRDPPALLVPGTRVRFEAVP